MYLLMSLFVAVLFFVLTPGVLLSLPSKKSDIYTLAAVHAVAFAVVYGLTHKAVMHMLYPEGFANAGIAACPKGKTLLSGVCV